MDWPKLEVTITPSKAVEACISSPPNLEVDLGRGISWNDLTGKPVNIVEMLLGIDGINTLFQASYSFFSPLVGVYLNGLKLASIDYTVILPDQIQLVEAPLVGDILEIDYLK